MGFLWISIILTLSSPRHHAHSRTTHVPYTICGSVLKIRALSTASAVENCAATHANVQLVNTSPSGARRSMTKTHPDSDDVHGARQQWPALWPIPRRTFIPQWPGGARRLLIHIEGTIATGKSTLLQKLPAPLREALGLRGKDDLLVVQEPVEKWREYGLLEQLYRGTIDKLAFQLSALLSRYATLERAIKESNPLIVIQERSVMGDYAFAQANLSGADLNAYLMSYNFINQTKNALTPNGGHRPLELYIFLKADKTVVRGRLEARGRNEEQSIPDEYMAKLDSMHDEFASGNGKFSMDPSYSKVKIIDANRKADDVCKDVCDYIVHQIQTLGVAPAATWGGASYSQQETECESEMPMSAKRPKVEPSLKE